WSPWADARSTCTGSRERSRGIEPEQHECIRGYETSRMYACILVVGAFPPLTTQRKGDPHARHARAHGRTHAPDPHAWRPRFGGRTLQTASLPCPRHRRHLQARLAADAGWHDAPAARCDGALHIHEDPPEL